MLAAHCARISYPRDVKTFQIFPDHDRTRAHQEFAKGGGGISRRIQTIFFLCIRIQVEHFLIVNTQNFVYFIYLNLEV